MGASALEAVRDALVPPRCAGCGRPGAWYCIACQNGSDPITRALGGVTLMRERQDNVRGAFAGVAGGLRSLLVALVDDVATTGATPLDAAAAARACVAAFDE